MMRYRNRSSNKPRTITVKYAGKCACCGAPIAAGELADYYPSRREIAHIGGLDGNSPRCAAEIRNRAYGGRYTRGDAGYADLDQMYEDSCSDICGR